MCPICSHWGGRFADVLQTGHHPHCPERPREPQTQCECGKTVASRGPCVWCGQSVSEQKEVADHVQPAADRQ